MLPLTNKGRIVGYTKVDDDVYAWAAARRWSLRSDGYVEGGSGNFLHRLILQTAAPRIDHINHDPLDNRRENLRPATVAQNAHNAVRHRDNKSGYKGVYFDKQTGRWRSQIMVEGRRISLGRFSTAEAASAAYDKACRELHGEFARPNGAS